MPALFAGLFIDNRMPLFSGGSEKNGSEPGGKQSFEGRTREIDFKEIGNTSREKMFAEDRR